MIKIEEMAGEGFTVLHKNDGIQIACITYSAQYDAPKEWKRHTLSDEAFALLRGGAVLFTEKDGTVLQVPIAFGKLYTVPKNTWHHLKVSYDALILVIERSDTAADNTERREYIC